MMRLVSGTVIAIAAVFLLPGIGFAKDATPKPLDLLLIALNRVDNPESQANILRGANHDAPRDEALAHRVEFAADRSGAIARHGRGSAKDKTVSHPVP